MSEMSKSARAASRAKARRLTGGNDPQRKVDASGWSPTEPLNTSRKTGARPVRPRIYKAGGKVQGDRGPRRADKKPRLAKDISEARTTRNVVGENQREFGNYHAGAFKKGGATAHRKKRDMGGMADPRETANEALAAASNRSGTEPNRMSFNSQRSPMSKNLGLKRGGAPSDKAQDAKLIKKAFRQHETAEHGGEHHAIKLKKGGASLGDSYKGGTRPTGGRIARASGGYSKDAVDKEIRKDKRIKPREAKQIHRLLQGRRDTAPAQGGVADIDRLNKMTNPEDRHRLMMEISPSYRAANGGDEGLKKGGRAARASGGSTYGSMDDKPRLRLVKTHTGPDGRVAKVYKDADWGEYRVKHYKDGKHQASADYHTDDAADAHGTAKAFFRSERKAGGRAKGKTNIHITIQQPQQQPSPLPPANAGPARPPMPPPAMPPGGLPPGAPPMPGGMNMPPPSMQPPPQPMMRKSGGRASSYKDMTAGALSGQGRLEKTDIAKRGTRRSGGRARSYRDMDAGALSGKGRLEKTEIAKHSQR